MDYVEENKSLTASFDCLTNDSPLKFKLYQKNNSGWSNVTLDIPASENVQTPQLTLTTSDNCEIIRILVESTIINQIFFIDNIIVQ